MRVSRSVPDDDVIFKLGARRVSVSKEDAETIVEWAHPENIPTRELHGRIRRALQGEVGDRDVALSEDHRYELALTLAAIEQAGHMTSGLVELLEVAREPITN